MNSVVRRFADPMLTVDDDDDSAKHDSIALRKTRTGWVAGDRQRFINLRRLPGWLVSDWLHKRRHHADLAELPFEPVRAGLFYSLRLGGVWVAADWWLRYFEVDESFTVLRLEHLSEDFTRLLMPCLNPNMLSESGLPHLNAAPLELEAPPNFSSPDISLMYQVNPLWANFERRLYVDS